MKPTPILSHPAVPPSLRRTQARGPLGPALVATLRAMLEPPAESAQDEELAVARIMDAIRNDR